LFDSFPVEWTSFSWLWPSKMINNYKPKYGPMLLAFLVCYYTMNRFPLIPTVGIDEAKFHTNAKQFKSSNGLTAVRDWTWVDLKKLTMSSIKESALSNNRKKINQGKTIVSVKHVVNASSRNLYCVRIEGTFEEEFRNKWCTHIEQAFDHGNAMFWSGPCKGCFL